jgi:hypothetical protein
MGWLIALGVLIALAILPIGISVHYDADGPLASLIAGPIRIRLFPGKPKQKKDKKKAKGSVKQTKKGKPKEQAKVKTNKKKGGSWTDFLPLVRIVLDFLDSFRRKIRVNRLELNLVMAGGDPCDLAVNYGKAWLALGNLMPQLERVFVIKKRDIEVECDFVASKTTVIAHLDLSITLGRLLAAVFKFLIKALVKFLQIKKKRKGGAVNEPDVT